MSSSNQKLPPKEAGIFKKVVRCYECKQYKNGLKFSKLILSNSKFRDHGETQAMKGLILNCMGRKEEAYEHVRKGLKNDIKSHVCWHVYGLLQRSDKKYEEATKCYRNALKWDKENVQILRDLSLLQIQMRDLEGFRDTRYQLLKSRPAQRSSWVGYALSYHLLKDYPMALKVMAEYRKTQSPQGSKPDYEYSEMILYEVQLMREAGKSEEALKHLSSCDSHICDVLTLYEMKAGIYLESGRLAEAELLYRDLINRNPASYSYHEKLEQCVKLGTPEERLKHYQALQVQYPRSHVARRIPLKFTSGETFVSLLDAYLRRSLHKGVPSLFMSIRSLYSDPEKTRAVGDTVSGYVDSLQSCSLFHPNDPGPLEPPSTLLWSLFLLAQHHDQCGDQPRAVDIIDRAIQHTPTDVQLYMLKARVYKHAGDYLEAAKWMEEARSLDTADRFVNCKCVKYLLRVSKVTQAIETAGLFTREGLPPLQTMDEMQCMWFQTELALAYRRMGRLGDALQKLHEIERHFVDMVDDQFDFHTYCMRKMTLRAYIGVLQLEDTLRHHPFYFEAAKNAIEIYLFLHDNPSAKTGGLNGSAENESNLSASELKKLQRKKKKAQLKAQAKAQEDKKENKPHNRAEEEKKAAEDKKESKFDPKELLAVEDPLEEAIKFLVPLQMLSRDRIEPHLLAYAIYSRKRKFLLMLQALKRTRAVAPESGGMHSALADFALEVESCRGDLPEPVQVVIDETLPLLTGGRDLSDLNRHFLAKNQDSLEHLIHGAQVLYRLHPEAKDRAVSLITNLSDGMKNRTLKMCAKVQQILRSGKFGDCSEALKVYEQSCHRLFPLATFFREEDPKEVPNEQLSENPPGGQDDNIKDECSGGQDN